MKTKFSKKRINSPKEGEFIYEQWRKIFSLFEIDEDINSDFSSEPRIIENISVEKIRLIFALGYRFSMFQTKQFINEETNYLSDSTDIKNERENLEDFLITMGNFLDEKIEDSFCLNSLDGLEAFSLSKKSRMHCENSPYRKDYLKW
jgi:hypothetical protein